ncbi:multi-sensor signal transduction histidine kinase [Methanolacinia petrolearia DSM 11571]|uniref:histidine kinase n=1 Tax=Methanolacinia petrolearia (strain DSM 11571 / OCM 486 / SEBR 4847) TaxID=679926 RepID=E1RGG2_METP4|nr:multi-sensor signal transduction histidine kinase [Methanolacinia petrolearia DSM 11571]
MAPLSIIYIDDDPHLLEIGKSFLEQSWEFSVKTFTCASEAAGDMLSGEHADVIISGSLDGISIFHTLRQHGITTPFILFTGDGRENTTINALTGENVFNVRKVGSPEQQFADLCKVILCAVGKGTKDAQEKNVELYRWLSENAPPEILENLNEVFYVLNVDATVIYVSRNIKPISGYSASDVIGRSYVELVHPEDIDGRLSQFLSNLSGSNEATEYRFLKADGSAAWVKTAARPIFIEGRVIGIQGILTDITSLKTMEEALRESEEQYRDLATNAPIGILTCDTEGNLTYINQRGLDLIGSPGEEETRTVNLLEYPSLINIGFSEMLQKSIDSGFSIPPFEGEYCSRWGKKAYYRVHISPIINQEIVTGARIILDDISEQKLSEIALDKANRKLKLLSEITRHDILNQIMVVQGYTEFAEELSVDTVQTDYLRKVKDAAAAIRRHTDFAREYERLDVEKPVWLSLDDIIGKMDDSPIPIIYDCSDISIHADPMVERVFLNLMDNTIRHADGATCVRIGCSMAGSGLLILWEDDGYGVPEDLKERIFDRGYGNNTGFGLFLAREILGITGIEITEKGVAGEGARFEILVPEGGYRLTG